VVQEVKAGVETEMYTLKRITWGMSGDVTIF